MGKLTHGHFDSCRNEPRSNHWPIASTLQNPTTYYPQKARRPPSDPRPDPEHCSDTCPVISASLLSFSFEIQSSQSRHYQSLSLSVYQMPPPILFLSLPRLPC